VFLLPLGFHQSGDGEPVQGAAATGPAHEPYGLPPAWEGGATM
jgi:hypothetical protein